MGVFMSILDKYAREPVTEKRTEQAGTRLEPSVYNSFVDHCTKRGLTTSEAIRYLILEVIQEEETKKINKSKRRITEYNSEISKGKQEVSATVAKLTNGNLLLTDENEVIQNIDLRKKKSKRQVRSIQQWTVDNLIPCPVCDPPRWITRTNYARHVKKHGYQNGYDLIQANLDKVEQMVKEKQGESEQ
jgi:antitoxin component of RelBE/YafQ-DinJ toxin-antitoxin module/uncharacterized C2H2 Zn-finger protein